MSTANAGRRASSTLRAQLSVTIVLMLVGVGMILGGITYGVGSLATPGSGFTPCLIGVALVGCGVVLLVQDIRGRAVDDDLFEDAELALAAAEEAIDDVPPGDPAASSAKAGARLPAMLAVLTCMACFAFVVLATPSLGLLVTTAVVVAVLAYIMRTSWWASILLGIGFYTASYLIFAMWLAIPLPFGTITMG